MPIKKDGTGKRWVEMELIVPGTPEQVWQAMATGAGNSAWFTKTTIEERAGGELRFDFGPVGASVGEVTEWAPPHRFGYVERAWSEGAPPCATEITITSRSGDRCLVRMVHSLFTSSDDWDDQMEGFEKGWPSFFEVLRVYLTHFTGFRGASFVVTVSLDGDQLTLWKSAMAQFGLGGANAGERRTMSGPEALTGVIESIQQRPDQRFLVMRLEEPAPGVAMIATYDAGPRTNVSVMIYCYGADADERVTLGKQTWKSWLDCHV